MLSSPVGALLSSLLELGILPGEGALRKAATRLCVFIVIFGCQGSLYLFAFLMTSLLASEDHMWLKQHLDFALLLLGCAAFPLAKTNLDGLQMPCAAWMLWGPIQSPLETLTARLSGLRGKCSLSSACVLFCKGGSPVKRLQNNACLENKPLASWLTKVKPVEVFVDECVCVCSRKRRLHCKVEFGGIPPRLPLQLSG